MKQNFNGIYISIQKFQLCFSTTLILYRFIRSNIDQLEWITTGETYMHSISNSLSMKYRVFRVSFPRNIALVDRIIYGSDIFVYDFMQICASNQKMTISYLICFWHIPKAAPKWNFIKIEFIVSSFKCNWKNYYFLRQRSRNDDE